MSNPHIYKTDIRYRDTDAQGHVYFANYFVFCDEAWGAYMRHIGVPYQGLAKFGVDTYYVNAKCEYVAAPSTKTKCTSKPTSRAWVGPA